MKTTFTVENERANEFELTLIEFDLTEAIHSVRESDFHTNFIFVDLNEEEEDLIQNLLENL